LDNAFFFGFCYLEEVFWCWTDVDCFACSCIYDIPVVRVFFSAEERASVFAAVWANDDWYT
jgi:hypothetical protein